MDFRYSAIAFRSVSVKYLRLFRTTSAMGPSGVVFPAPVLRKVAMSLTVQAPSPVVTSDVRLSANQPSTPAPVKSLSFSNPPRRLRGEWQALQWPRPSTRYAPRFQEAVLAGSGAYVPFVKYSSRHPIIDMRISKGKYRWLTSTALRTV